MAKPTTFRPGHHRERKNGVFILSWLIMIMKLKAPTLQNWSWQYWRGYEKCSEGGEMHLNGITAWRETCSYLHCCSPPGPQQWCNGKMACHQIHPPGDLREERRGEDEDHLQGGAEPQGTHSRLTFLGQFHLVLTFLVFSKFLEQKQKTIGYYGYRQYPSLDYWHFSD